MNDYVIDSERLAAAFTAIRGLGKAIEQMAGAIVPVIAPLHDAFPTAGPGPTVNRAARRRRHTSPARPGWMAITPPVDPAHRHGLRSTLASKRR